MAKMLTAILMIFGLAAVACTADEDPPRVFKTADEAAVYALTRAYEHSHYYEYGGVILKMGENKYVVSVPISQHHGMDVSFSEDPEDYPYPQAASYHVHPCLKDAFASVFSPQDLADSRESHLAGYMLDECTGEIHYWAPGDGYLDLDALLKLGVSPVQLQHGVQLSPGKIIGHIAVTGEQLN